MKEFNKILIFVKLGLEKSDELATICKNLEELGKKYEILLNDRREELGAKIKEFDMVISLGGDGNLISCCRQIAHTKIPVLGVYAGNLGFLTETKVEEFKNVFDEIEKKKYKIWRPFLLSVQIRLTNGEILNKFAFNDAVFSRENHLSLAKIKTSYKNNTFNIYSSDGLIISTPAGSTAYNLSAGGSIIFPLSRVFAITPICAHSLTQRPIILPKSFFVDIKPSNYSLSLDGQLFYKASEIESVKIGLSNVRANLIRKFDSSYFSVLQEKLHWGEK